MFFLFNLGLCKLSQVFSGGGGDRCWVEWHCSTAPTSRGQCCSNQCHSPHREHLGINSLFRNILPAITELISCGKFTTQLGLQGNKYMNTRTISINQCIQWENYGYCNTGERKKLNQPFDNTVYKSQYSPGVLAYYQQARKAQSKIIEGEVIEQSLEVAALQHWALLSTLSKSWLFSSVCRVVVKWKWHFWLFSKSRLLFLLLPKMCFTCCVLCAP